MGTDSERPVERGGEEGPPKHGRTLRIAGIVTAVAAATAAVGQAVSAWLEALSPFIN